MAWRMTRGVEADGRFESASHYLDKLALHDARIWLARLVGFDCTQLPNNRIVSLSNVSHYDPLARLQQPLLLGILQGLERQWACGCLQLLHGDAVFS